MDLEPDIDVVTVAWIGAKQHLQLLGIKVVQAAGQVLAILAFLGLHRGLDEVARRIMPDNFELVLRFVEAILALGFVVISVQLVFDMVVLFVPRLRQQDRS